MKCDYIKRLITLTGDYIKRLLLLFEIVSLKFSTDLWIVRRHRRRCTFPERISIGVDFVGCQIVRRTEEVVDSLKIEKNRFQTGFTKAANLFQFFPADQLKSAKVLPAEHIKYRKLRKCARGSIWKCQKSLILVKGLWPFK